MTDRTSEQPSANPTAPEARACGFPAVHGHEVVALRGVAREDDSATAAPGKVECVRWRDGRTESAELPAERLYVWARAGRVSFADKGGNSVNLVLLGEHEYEDLPLGAPWPRTHNRESTMSNLARGAVDDLKNAVTFPSSFPRMMKTSGERNVVLDMLVGWCEREIPDIHVLRGWPRGAERPHRTQVSGLHHKGLIGEHGWLPDTVGEHPEGWSPFGNDRNAGREDPRPKSHEHASGA